MHEVTVTNFDAVLPELERVLKGARFVAVDLEFSCLRAFNNHQASILDSPKERYRKLRETVQQLSPLQIGLTAFDFQPEKYAYNAHAFNFYVYPRALFSNDVSFVCQASSLQFLSSHGFDFSKCINEGVSFLNRPQEENLMELLQSDIAKLEELSPFDVFDLEEILNEIQNWAKSKKEDAENVYVISTEGKSLEFHYLLHRQLISSLKSISVVEENSGFKLVRLRNGQSDDKVDVTKLYLKNLLGFTRVFRLLTSLRVPLVGHNLLLDMLILIDKLEQPLPTSYFDFKRLAHRLFPTVYDTKMLSFELRRNLSREKRFSSTALEDLYIYFRDKEGRHLAQHNSPLIEPVSTERLVQQFHHAGWDSYCTGYIFVRMAHIFASQTNSNKKKQFMFSELLRAVESMKNKINMMKGNRKYIQLDNDDPPSKMPPRLVIQNLTNQPLNLRRVACLLEPCGSVEIRPLSHKDCSAVIAVDNFVSARRILTQFNGHPDYRIEQYSILRHSRFAKTFLWSTVFVSGVALAWYSFKKME